MRPLRIATLHSYKDRSFLVRCHDPLSWLQNQAAIEWLPPMKAWEADVVLLHRQWQPGALAVVRSLQRHGIRVIADVQEQLSEVKPLARQLCETVDAVLVPNEFLASRLSRFNSKVVVSPSGIDLASWRKLLAPKPRDRVRTVGFAGSASHTANIEILRPALATLSNKFKEQGIRFVCFGFQPPWLSGVVPGSEKVETLPSRGLSGKPRQVGIGPCTGSADEQHAQ